MPTQTFDTIDYLGPVVVGGIFFIALFVLNVIFNFTLINKEDEISQFEIIGKRLNMRLGPHSLKHVGEELEKKKIKKDRS